MKNILEQKVYYSDTDAYGVVWHGSYLRWMEMGRVELCEKAGLNLINLEAQDIAMPVTNMNVRYKASARLNDVVVIETSIKEISPIRVTFEQIIRNKADGKLFIKAEFEVVAIHNDGSIYRKLPEAIVNAFNKVEVCQG